MTAFWRLMCGIGLVAALLTFNAGEEAKALFLLVLGVGCGIRGAMETRKK